MTPERLKEMVETTGDWRDAMSDFLVDIDDDARTQEQRDATAALIVLAPTLATLLAEAVEALRREGHSEAYTHNYAEFGPLGEVVGTECPSCAFLSRFSEVEG